MKNKILKAITYVNFIMWLVSGCMLDSVSVVPILVWFVNSAWLVLFTYANKERFMYGC